MKINKTHLYTTFLLPLVAALGLSLSDRVAAQTFTSLHSFTRYVDGVSLQAGVVLSGNTLYGTTEYGGPSGNNSTLFAVNTNGAGFRIVYNFPAEANNNLGFPTNSGAGGSDGTLVLSGNNLYGASYDGGTNGTGAVFAVNTNGTFTLLYSLNAAKTNPVTGLFTNSDGYGSEAGLILSGSTLYGTTEHGGTSGYGVVFKVNTNGTGFVNLHSFTNGTDGSVPHTLVISGSTLYGTTLGFSGNGTVFALGTNGVGFTTLHTFTATNFIFPQGGAPSGPGYTNSDGVGPSGLSLSGNTLYGTAFWGGSNGCGTVFALNTNGTGFTTLHSFAAGRTNSSGVYTNSEGLGALAFTGLVLSSNILYGAAYYGGSAGNGTIFSLNTNGTGFTTLYNFSATNASGGNNDGANPYAGLTLSSNTLYGTTKYGGTSGNGTVFSIYLGLAVITTSLPNGTNGQAYSQTLIAAGGQQPYTWTNILGALPSGLRLAANGLITGSTTNNGKFSFTVKVTDAIGNSAIQTLILPVVPLVAIQPQNNLNVQVGSNASLTVTVGGNGPFSYQWQFNGTNLPNFITTVAGGGNSGLGDAGAATNAELNYPESVAVDTSGNLFIADRGNNRIREVGTNGIITTVAGNGYQDQFGNGAYSGDGGPATVAELNQPDGVAIDANGNIFIADRYNERIRKVGVNGIITTVAGNGDSPMPYEGSFSGDGGPATNAELNVPIGVAVDGSGNIFIADMNNQRIRKVDAFGVITTVAGNGYQDQFGNGGYSGDGGPATVAELSSPAGVAVDATGNLFIADTVNNIIRIVRTNGIINRIAGNRVGSYRGDGGAATNAEVYAPAGVAVGPTGNILIADQINWRIREVGTNGIISTVAGNGTNAYAGDGGSATGAALSYPSGVAEDNAGNLFIADSGNNVVREVAIQGPILTLNNLNSGNAGAYDVVVSGAYGSVTSSVVMLTVTIPFPFTASSTTGQVPMTVQFTSPGIDSVGNAFNRWNWNFGDGASSTNQSPLHVYTSVGTFQPSLMATNSLGIAISGYGPAITASLPTISFSASPTNGLSPLAVQFTSPGVDSGGNVISSWNWNFGDGSTSTAANPLHFYTGAGTFQPTLVVTNSHGYALSAAGPSIQPNICAMSAPQGLVSWWSGNGNALDSISGNNGLVLGGLVYTDGMVGQAFNFDGTSTYLNTSQMVSNPQNFTMAMWFKTTTTQGGLLLGFDSSQTGNSSTYDRHLYMDSSGLLHFGTYNSGVQVVSSSASYNNGTWHHAAAILSAVSGSSLFVDGQLLTNKPSFTTAVNYNGYWRIGENTLTGWPSLPNSPYFAGALDELMLFNRPLSSSEIQAIYQAGTNGVCPPTPLMFMGVPSFSKASGVVLNASLRSGQNYHLQSNTNLASTNWITLTNFVAGTAPISHLTNQPPTNAPQGFYRIVSP